MRTDFIYLSSVWLTSYEALVVLADGHVVTVYLGMLERDARVTWRTTRVGIEGNSDFLPKGNWETWRTTRGVIDALDGRTTRHLAADLAAQRWPASLLRGVITRVRVGRSYEAEIWHGLRVIAGP